MLAMDMGFANNDPYVTADTYYSRDFKNSQAFRPRALSIRTDPTPLEGDAELGKDIKPTRRGSIDLSMEPKQLLIDVEPTLEKLLKAEDTDGNYQITVDDAGPKVYAVGTANSNGINKYEIRGAYQLSNLLQELTLAHRRHKKTIVLDERRLNENPVSRLRRVIKTEFWVNLTRKVDKNSVAKILADPKNRTNDHRPRVYVPAGDKEVLEWYKQVAKEQPDLHLDVCLLPPTDKVDGAYVRSLNEKPGLLALAMEKNANGELEGVPYVVPGDRFNELYGWDSYFSSLGLLTDGRVDLARGIVVNFIYEIVHYGKIPNANRSYFLGRSQPPFLTDLAIRVYDAMKETDPAGALDLLKHAMQAAIKEYKTVWTSLPRLDPITGLSRYRPVGEGIPPEVEASHFEVTLQPYADKHHMSLENFERDYTDQKISEPELDKFFLHDRGVRESGHDTSYRVVGVCADLATIDLNSLLYKYEKDIANVISNTFNDKLEMPDGSIESSAIWTERAHQRKLAVDKYLWNEEAGMYFDYNTKSKQQHKFESETTLWALWAGISSPHQAACMVERALPIFEKAGGLVTGSEKSRGKISLVRPHLQWDYPYGWAPQQILAWKGLFDYGYHAEAYRLVYRWVYMITKCFVDYNGVVVEKYNVVEKGASHKVDAEYGNQGSGFKGVSTEGFGWTNASYTIGMTYLDKHALRALGALTPPEVFFKLTNTTKSNS